MTPQNEPTSPVYCSFSLCIPYLPSPTEWIFIQQQNVMGNGIRDTGSSPSSESLAVLTPPDCLISLSITSSGYETKLLREILLIPLTLSDSHLRAPSTVPGTSQPYPGSIPFGISKKVHPFLECPRYLETLFLFLSCLFGVFLLPLLYFFKVSSVRVVNHPKGCQSLWGGVPLGTNTVWTRWAPHPQSGPLALCLASAHCRELGHLQ